MDKGAFVETVKAKVEEWEEQMLAAKPDRFTDPFLTQIRALLVKLRRPLDEIDPAAITDEVAALNAFMKRKLSN